MYKTSNPVKKIRVSKACLEAVQVVLTRFSLADIQAAILVLNPPMEALQGPYGRILH